MVLTKEALLARKQTKEVALSDGESVFLKPMPASFFIGADSGDEKKLDSVTMIAASLCDADGNLFFDGDADRGAVLSIPLTDFSLLTDAIIELNGLKKDAQGESDVGKN